jgi:hypothetical protein
MKNTNFDPNSYFNGRKFLQKSILAKSSVIFLLISLDIRARVILNTVYVVS